MPKLRILIVDDEPLARERLRYFLARDDSREVIGECGDGIEALSTIRRERPDLVFLDVQMPRCNGFEVLERLPADHRPEIIFVTAHDRFAVEAFTTHAIDYLLKPFHEQRLQQALHRASNHIATRRAGELGRKLESLIATPPTRVPERLAVRTDGRVVFVKRNEILWIEAANNYCILHLANATRLMLRESLSSLEQRLGSDCFARVNRSAVVRMDQVKELHLVSYGDYVVVLQNGTRLSLSRNLRGQFERFAGEGI